MKTPKRRNRAVRLSIGPAPLLPCEICLEAEKLYQAAPRRQSKEADRIMAKHPRCKGRKMQSRPYNNQRRGCGLLFGGHHIAEKTWRGYCQWCTEKYQ